MVLFLGCLMLGFILSFVILFLGMGLSSKEDINKESGSAYECGFDSFISARIPFSLQFFLIGVIFLVFDVEIVLMVPLPLVVEMNFMVMGWFFIFVLLLLFGLYFEWKEGSLNWVW